MIASLPGVRESAPAARTPRRSVRHRGTLLLLALVVIVAVPATATRVLAHARLQRSSPSAGAVLGTTPAAADLWFNELLDDAFNDVQVFHAKSDGAPDGASLVSAQPTVDPSDRTHLTVGLPALTPGRYVLQWKVLSRDGHSARGQVLFRVGPGE